MFMSPLSANTVQKHASSSHFLASIYKTWVGNCNIEVTCTTCDRSSQAYLTMCALWFARCLKAPYPSFLQPQAIHWAPGELPYLYKWQGIKLSIKSIKDPPRGEESNLSPCVLIFSLSPAFLPAPLAHSVLEKMHTVLLAGLIRHVEYTKAGRHCDHTINVLGLPSDEEKAPQDSELLLPFRPTHFYLTKPPNSSCSAEVSAWILFFNMSLVYLSDLAGSQGFFNHYLCASGLSDVGKGRNDTTTSLSREHSDSISRSSLILI